MNPDTTVIVCGYEGDGHQVNAFMPLYKHHGCPVVIMSPEDSPIPEIPGTATIRAGKRAYIGQDSLVRQWLHMKAALDFPSKFYLFNDSDSFCITPEIPAYVYQSEFLWSNEVEDFRVPGFDGIPASYHEGFEQIAMQPPYFMSRAILERLVSAGENIQADPITPFIDWYMVQVCYKAGMKHRHKGFVDGASFTTFDLHHARLMAHEVQHKGKNMLHSVKNLVVAEMLVEARNMRL